MYRSNIIGASCVELTQEEYNNLSDIQKNNGTLYFITDVTGGDPIVHPTIYSENEREIGVWIDGKPLYEVTKSFQYDTSWGGTRAQISHDILNIDTPVDINCRFYNRENGALFKTVIRAENDAYTSDGGYYQSSLELNVQAFTSTNFVVAFGDNYYANNINIDMAVTFRYTKSTDQAGSGTWTPQGVPSHHYSTDEQVVGTWIDGSTLYERSFDLSQFLTVSANAWVSTSISSSGINRIVNCLGSSATGTFWGQLMASRDEDNVIKLGNARDTAITVKTFTIQYTKSSS